MPTSPITPDLDPPAGYRTVNFWGDVICGIAALLNVSTDGSLQQTTFERWCGRINAWFRRGWEIYPFKEFELTEERAFRQEYASELNYAAGEEVYDAETDAYYAALETIAPDETPTDNPEKWALLSPVERFIENFQFGKQAIGDVLAVHLTDPRDNCYAPPVLWQRSANGIDLSSYVGGNTVWITYRPQQPVFTGEPYDVLVNYSLYALVYDPVTQECYRSMIANNLGHAVTNQFDWLLQRFPYAFADYVKNAVASDFTEDLGTKQFLLMEAKTALQHEIDRELTQGVRHTWGRGVRGDCGRYSSDIPVALYGVPVPTI